MSGAPILTVQATNAAFFTVFGIFVAAMLVLIAFIIVWAVRHDMAGLREWRQRQAHAQEAQPQAPRRPPRRPGS